MCEFSQRGGGHPLPSCDLPSPRSTRSKRSRAVAGRCTGRYRPRKEHHLSSEAPIERKPARTTLSLRRMAACAGLMLGGVALSLTGAQAQSSSTSCRASAARALVSGQVTSEPTVANPSGTPCATQNQEVAGVQPVGDSLTVSDPKASTRSDRGVLAAAASVDGAQIGGATAIAVGHVDGDPAAVLHEGCDDRLGLLAAWTGSRSADNPVTIIGGQTIDQTVMGVRIRTNQVSGSTRTGLILDVGPDEYVLGEASAAGDACASLAAGPGEGGDTPADRICPKGATYEVSDNVCVISIRGADGSQQTIVIGRPYSGPSGGTVIALTDGSRARSRGQAGQQRLPEWPGSEVRGPRHEGQGPHHRHEPGRPDPGPRRQRPDRRWPRQRLRLRRHGQRHADRRRRLRPHVRRRRQGPPERRTGHGSR